MSKIKIMKGLIFNKIQQGNESSNLLTIENDWVEIVFKPEEEYSSDINLEDVVGDLNDLLDTPILIAESSEVDKFETGDEYSDHSTATFYKLATKKGYVDMRFYGTGGAMYSTSVLVDFNLKHYNATLLDQYLCDFSNIKDIFDFKEFNPTIEVLMRLADQDKQTIRTTQLESIIKNSTKVTATLCREMALSNSIFLKEVAAIHQKTEESVLEALAYSKEPSVLSNLSIRPLPPYLCQILLDQFIIQKNGGFWFPKQKQLMSKDLDKMLEFNIQNKKEYFSVSCIVENKNSNEIIWRKIAESSSEYMRQVLAFSNIKKLPRDIKIALATDVSVIVRDRIVHNYNIEEDIRKIAKEINCNLKSKVKF